MGKQIETTINTFDGAIVNDVRDPRKDVCRMVSNFDVSSSSRMTPYRDSESGDTAAATSQKQNFEIALRTGTTYSLYSLGVKSGAGTAEIMYKNLTTGSATDLDDGDWATPSNNQSSAGAVNMNLFVYYAKTALIYGARAGTHIWAFDPSGGAWGDTENALAYTNIAQGIVHSKDDILYIPYDNKIAKNDNGAWTDIALTLPAHYKINSICEYGNYLAIGCTPLSSTGNSRVFLWNMDSDSWDSEYDAGPDELRVLSEITGYLVSVSISGGTTIRNNDKIVFRYLSGLRFKKYDELIADTATTSTLVTINQTLDNRVYFLLKITLDGVVRDGLWSFGRSLLEERFTVVHERTSYNDTALGNGVLRGFYKIGDYTFISSENNAGAFQLSKTNDQAKYTATSIYEKLFNNGLRNGKKVKDSSQTKKLIGATVMTAPMPSAGQIVLKYKIDAESSWTTIFTNTTDDSISHSAINDASGANLPQYKEIRLRIESTGGAEITGLSFLEEVIDKRLY